MRQIKSHLRTLIAKHSVKTGKRLSYRDLYSEIGISPNTLSLLANNRQKLFDRSVMERLCDFFGCELHDLIRLEDIEDE
jgi:putative transcriptional regulator